MNTALLQDAVAAAQHIVIIQAENPDGDSIGTSLALEEILGDMGKKVSLHCPVDIPKYLRYITGWDRVTTDFPMSADLAIIVDTVSDTLLSKTLEMPGVRSFLETNPVIAIDHHENVASSLPFPHELVIDERGVSTGEAIYKISQEQNWTINQQAAEQLLISILSDTLGLTTPNVTAESYRIAGELVALGAHPAVIEERRREYMKKAPEILSYKGALLQRIEYAADGALAYVHIPWDDIQAYSDQYNPGALVIDEMRLVEGVQVAVAIKTYPDGKLTGKIRSNLPVADKIAGFFGGGGHAYAAGFRIYDNYDTACHDLISATNKILSEYEKESHDTTSQHPNPTT